MIPFGHDGKAKPVYDMGYGTVGFTPFKKTDEGRIRELLALMDYLSAPFGTKEYLVRRTSAWRGSSTHWTRKKNPVLTKAGQRSRRPVWSVRCRS